MNAETRSAVRKLRYIAEGAPLELTKAEAEAVLAELFKAAK